MNAFPIEGVDGLFVAQVTIGGLPSGESLTRTFVVGCDPYDPTKPNKGELEAKYTIWRAEVRAAYGR